MSTLRDSLVDYLTMRRALGYKLRRPQKLLAQFVDYLDSIGAEHVKIENAAAWARLPTNGSLTWWASRLSIARSFAIYLHTLDPAHQVPPADVLPYRSHRATPYLYSDQDIRALIAAADTLRFPLRTATYKTLIGLLAVTGMRIGEAISLNCDDLDLGQSVLIVRTGKFGKSRELPLHATTMQSLRAYLHCRGHLRPAPNTRALFVSDVGTRLLYCNVSWTFLKLVDIAGLRPRLASCRPRLHDLRHSFAMRTLLDWYNAGVDVQPRLPLLSTYLGHVNPGATYWYLSAAPDLMILASNRLEKAMGGRP
jgi:integrase/recombinase XerD